eukprot:g15508.t1
MAGALCLTSVLFMAMPLSVLGNAMSQTWADRHRIVLITQTRQKLKNLGYTAEHMPKLFSKFDKDGNGELEMDEFCDLVAKMRIGMKPSEATELFLAFDENGDGRLCKWRLWTAEVLARRWPERGLCLTVDDLEEAIRTIRQLRDVAAMQSLRLTASTLSLEGFRRLLEEVKHLKQLMRGRKDCDVLRGVEWRRIASSANPAENFLHCRLGGSPLLSLRNGQLLALQARCCSVDAAQLNDLAQDFGRPTPKFSAMDLIAKPESASCAERAGLSPLGPLAWKLQCLDLSENHLTGAGRSLGVFLRTLPELTRLSVESCSLTMEDLEQIARALVRSSIHRLDLAQNRLRSEGTLLIARMLPKNEIGDILVLNELKLAHDKRPFAGLRLAGNRFSNSTLNAFSASLKKMAKVCPPGCRCFEGRGEVM